MKRMITVALACAAGLAVPLMPAAQTGNMSGGEHGASVMRGQRAMQNMQDPRAIANMSEGEVRKVDSAAGKLTLRHGPLENMDMPAMTMVFRVRDPAWLSQLKVGDRVRFVAERVDGNLTVTALAPAKE